MKCIMLIKTEYGDYRVYYDIDRKDWLILTPNFKMHRNIHNAGLAKYKEKIEKRIEEARSGKIRFNVR